MLKAEVSNENKQDRFGRRLRRRAQEILNLINTKVQWHTLMKSNNIGLGTEAP